VAQTRGSTPEEFVTPWQAVREPCHLTEEVFGRHRQLLGRRNVRLSVCRASLASHFAGRDDHEANVLEVVISGTAQSWVIVNNWQTLVDYCARP
jgi:hypothetical protein